MATYNAVAGKTDQADYYYRHSFDIGSEPEFVGVTKKNEDGFSNLDYMNLKKDH